MKVEFFRTDPLLSSDSFKLTSDNNVLNLYRILSSYDKSTTSLTSIYHINQNSAIFLVSLLEKKYKNIDNAAVKLLEGLECYRGQHYASKIKEKWRVKDNLVKGNITIQCARVASILLTNSSLESIRLFNEILMRSNFFIEQGRQIRIPIQIEELNSELAYLAGVIAGDGHINTDLNEMKVVDGHRNNSFRGYSLKFLNSINLLIERNFHYKGHMEIPNPNYFVCRYSCSLVCRLINYVYGIPRGNKSRKIRVPDILKQTDKESLFWRGLFDADGAIRKGPKSINLTTSSRDLYSDFSHFAKNKKIVFFGKMKGQKHSIHILEEAIPQFVRIIGTSHPRKQENLVEYMKKGATYKVPKAIKPNKKLENIIEYLRPYENNIYVRLTAKREKTSKNELTARMSSIKEKLNHNLVRVKRERKNDHYYICSKELLNEINEHYEFVQSWPPFKEQEIIELTERWNNYE